MTRLTQSPRILQLDRRRERALRRAIRPPRCLRHVKGTTATVGGIRWTWRTSDGVWVRALGDLPVAVRDADGRLRVWNALAGDYGVVRDVAATPVATPKVIRPTTIRCRARAPRTARSVRRAVRRAAQKAAPASSDGSSGGDPPQPPSIHRDLALAVEVRQ